MVLDLRVLINVEGNGVVEYVDVEKIIIKYDCIEEEKMVSFDGDLKIYNFIKFRKIN